MCYGIEAEGSAVTWEHIINDASVVSRENIAWCCVVCNSSKGTRTYLKISNGALVHSAWPVWADFMPYLVYRSLRGTE